MTKPKDNPQKGGRPTKYKEEYSDEEFMNEFKEHCKAKGKLISLCAFAVYVRVTEDTLTNWGKANPEFLGALGEIKQASKDMLVSKGLKGDYNSTITKLMLSSNHGMREKTDIEHSGGINVIIEN